VFCLAFKDAHLEHPNRGLFSRHDFVYDAQNDYYTCPGRNLTKARCDRTGGTASTNIATWPPA